MRAIIQYLHVHSSTPGPLLLLSDGTPLNRQRLTSSSQSILSAAGVPGCYTGHTASALLAQLFQQPLVAYQITSPRHLANGSRYVSDL